MFNSYDIERIKFNFWLLSMWISTKSCVKKIFPIRKFFFCFVLVEKPISFDCEDFTDTYTHTPPPPPLVSHSVWKIKFIDNQNGGAQLQIDSNSAIFFAYFAIFSCNSTIRYVTIKYLIKYKFNPVVKCVRHNCLSLLIVLNGNWNWNNLMTNFNLFYFTIL